MVQIRLVCNVYPFTLGIHVCGFPARVMLAVGKMQAFGHLDSLDSLDIFTLLGSLTPLLRSRRHGTGLISAEYRVLELSCC